MKSHPWRKIFRLGSRLTMAVLLISATSCSERGTAGTDYTQFVNPLIGTGGHGHTFPGPVVPHGMVQPGPDTRLDGWDSCSGYYYNDSTINGFSHNRLSGTGCCDYGDVLLMPTVGEQCIGTEEPTGQQMPYCSSFSHDDEVAVPGYYSVYLSRYGVRAELTATCRAAIHRYTYPATSGAGMILDLDYSLQRQTNRDMLIEQVNDLRQGKAIEQPTYSYILSNRLPETIHVEQKPVVIIEGIMVLFNKELRDMMDLKVFVDTDSDERLIRNIERDTTNRGRTVSMVLDRYRKVLKPTHEQFIEPTKRYADIIVPQGGENRRGIEILCRYIEGLVPKNLQNGEK